MENHPASIPPRPFTFRQCLLLCIPALVIGFILRASFIAAMPEIYYGADSNSYFSTASKLWNEGEFELSKKRRYLYPLMMSALPALPGSTAVAASLLQHLTGLAIIVGVGWVAGQLTVYRAVAVPIATILAGVWTRMLWYEHEMIAEVFVLAAVVATVACALPLARLRTSRGLLWFLICVTLIIAFKPHGKPFWVAFMAFALVYTWRKVRWDLKHWAVLAVSLFVLVNGGSGSQGSWLLLNSALPLVKTEGEKWSEYREALRPMIEESRADLVNYGHNQTRYKKSLNKKEPDGPLGPVWGKLVEDKEKFSKVAKSLAFEGILSEPFTYAMMVWRKTVKALADDDPGATIDPKRFWTKQVESNGDRWEKRPNEMKLVYEMDAAEFEQLVEKRKTAPLWFAKYIPWFDQNMAWTYFKRGEPGVPPSYGVKVMGALALFGLLTCLWPRQFVATAIVWWPPIFYYFAIYGVGDAVTRYLHPADWCWFVVIAVGVDSVLRVSARLFRRHSAPTPAEAPTSELTPV